MIETPDRRDTSAGDDTMSMIGAAVDAFAQADPLRTRRSRDAHQGFEPAVWQEMARLGWLAAHLPESHGGLGLGLAAAARIAQRLGYAGYFEPYVPAAVMPLVALAECEGPYAAELIGSIGDGRTVAALAWQPVDGRFLPSDTEVTATEHDGGMRLSGDCRFIAASAPGTLLVAARSGRTPVLCAVDARQRGVAFVTERAVDGSNLLRLALLDAACPPTHVLARGKAAQRALDAALRAGVLGTAAELLGVIERALELTIGYLQERRQFGQPIGAFQALQHRAVDMWIQQELTRAAVRAAVDRYGTVTSAESAAAADAAASGAKARASTAAVYVCGQAVQLHGAIGFTDEYALGHYVNRALVLAARLGTGAQHRRRFVDLRPAADGGNDARRKR